MKKTLAFLLSLALIFSALPIMMASAAESAETPAKGSLESFIKLSDGAELVESTDNSLKSGEVCFTVSLPKNGYVQFDQQLSKLISDNSFDNSKRIVVKVGDRTKNDYIYSNFYVQLTASEYASSDIVPVDEPNGVEPGTKAITYHFYGPADNPGSIYGVNKGSSQVGAGQFSLISTIADHSVPICFTKEEDGKLTVSQRYGGQYPAQYAYRKCKSTHTLSEIGGDDGVYVRLRNGESDTQTYTVYIISPDVTTAYQNGKYKFSDNLSELISSRTYFENGYMVENATVKLSANGGYVQLDKKYKDFVNGKAIYTYLKPGDGAKADYDAIRAQIQITKDSDALIDIPTVNEYTTTPSTNGMTWLFYGSGGIIYTGTGSSTAGGSCSVSTGNSSFLANGVPMRLVKTDDDKIDGIYEYQTNHCCSKRTLTEIGGNDGIYLRVRNTASTAVYYTFTFKSSVIDIDCDGISGASDLTVLRQSLLTSGGIDLPEADFNSDGSVNLYDLVRFKRMICMNSFFETVNIDIDGVLNSRDIGGYTSMNGMCVKNRMVYRSAKLDDITQAGINTALNQYNIKTDLDLRIAGEGLAGKGSPLGESVNYVNISGPYYLTADGIDKTKCHPNLVKEIEVFADPENYPIIIHCSIGRDRTGTLCLLLNGLLGAGKDYLLEDYKLSLEYVGGDTNSMINNFNQTYNYLATYGGTDDKPFSYHVEKFMLDIGVSQEKIDAIKMNLLENK